MTDPKKRGLGRGLSALLPSQAAPAASPAGSARSAEERAVAADSSSPPGGREPARTEGRGKQLLTAEIEDVYPGPEQPRRRFDDQELEELASSVRTHGIIMPLVVRPRPAGGFFLIAGERRWRAAQRAGLHQVPVVVQDVSPQSAFERALVENLQRADLRPIEEAAAFQRLVDEFGLTQEQIAERVGKDRSTIANSMRLLKLPVHVREMVEERSLSMGHARALLALPSDAEIETAARAVVAKGLSVRATEALVKKAQKGPSPEPSGPPAKTPAVRDLEERLTKALGGPVTIVQDGNAKGHIEIGYLSLDHLDQILDKLL
jgi:ParB family transcriptional regulator, chromosome partitioning protein